jgi:hypothetical protein
VAKKQQSTASARDNTGRFMRGRARAAANNPPAKSKPARKPIPAATSPKARVAAVIASKRQQSALDAARKARPDKTIPAGGGDETEAKIIESLANPEHRPLSVIQRCELIGIARATWYRHMADPLFKARASAAIKDAVGDRLGEVLEALLLSALIPGRDGHPDRKLYLELTGHYEQSSKLKLQEEGPKKKGQEMTDDELLAQFEGREDLLPPGLLRRLGRDPDADETVTPKHGGSNGKGSQSKKAAA